MSTNKVQITSDFLDIFWEEDNSGIADVKFVLPKDTVLKPTTTRVYNAIVEIDFDELMSEITEVEITFLGLVEEPEEPQEPIALSAAPNSWEGILQAVRESQDYQEYDYLCQLMLAKIKRLEASLK